MTDNNISTSRSSYSPQPTERTLRIDGERSSAFFNTAIRVARLDSRLRDLAGVQNPDARKSYRQACEAYSKAIGMFEDELSSIERDLAVTRRGPRNAGANNGATRPRRDKAPAQTGAQRNTPNGSSKSNLPEQTLEAKAQKQPQEAKAQKQPQEAKQQPQEAKKQQQQQQQPREAKKQKPNAPQQQADQRVNQAPAPAPSNAPQSQHAATAANVESDLAVQSVAETTPVEPVVL